MRGGLSDSDCCEVNIISAVMCKVSLHSFSDEVDLVIETLGTKLFTSAVEINEAPETN